MVTEHLRPEEILTNGSKENAGDKTHILDLKTTTMSPFPTELLLFLLICMIGICIPLGKAAFKEHKEAKRMKQKLDQQPKTGQVISMNKMSQEEIDYLLSLDEFEQKISGN